MEKTGLCHKFGGALQSARISTTGVSVFASNDFPMGLLTLIFMNA